MGSSNGLDQTILKRAKFQRNSSRAVVLQDCPRFSRVGIDDMNNQYISNSCHKRTAIFNLPTAIHARTTYSKLVAMLGLVAIVSIVTGCATLTNKQSALKVKPTVTHKYNITAVDVANRPLTGVAVDIQLYSSATIGQTVNCTTDETGRCPPLYYEVHGVSLPNSVSYSSTAEVKATKNGYYSASASGQSSAGSTYGTHDQTDLRLKMIHPTDYLDDSFAVSATDHDLRERVLRFLEVIRLQSILVDAEVVLKGIGTSEFNGKKYLRLTVNSTTTYNSLKLNKYDIGKRLFDETVRKVLTPLNDNIAAPKAYYGYDITVYGHTKSFVDEYATANKIEYRFLLPEVAVRRYKKKDISGQALLDAGVQLMDDERVEFKLQ